MSVYVQLDPIEQKATWSPSSGVTWNLNMVSKDFVANSLSITANVLVNLTNFNGTYLYLDPLVGAHGFFTDFVQQTDNLGMMKSDSNYGRYVKMVRESNLDKSTTAFMGKEMCLGTTTDFRYFNGNSFKIKPLIMLNGSNVNLSYEKTGNITISTWIQPANRVFYTDATNVEFTYTLTNLKLQYAVLPSKGYKGKVLFQSYHSEIPSLVSTNQSFQNNIGNMAVGSVACSFQRATSAQNATINPFILENIGVKQVDFLFNDLVNGLFSYSLKKPEEIILNGLSLNMNNLTSFYPDASDLNQYCPLVGLKFPNALDMSIEKFTLNVQSTIPDNTPANTFNAHLFFSGVKIF